MSERPQVLRSLVNGGVTQKKTLGYLKSAKVSNFDLTTNLKNLHST